MKRFSCAGLVSAVIVVLLLFSGCGGGGGGGNGSSGTGTYSGLTTPATLTEENAQDILEDAYYGGVLAETMAAPLSAVEAEGVGRKRPRSVQDMASRVKGIVEQAIVQADSQIPAGAGAIQTVTIEESGECGGEVTGSMQVNDVTRSFTGSITFNSYCESGFRTNGTVSLVGEMDLDTSEFSMTMTFTNVTGVCEDDDIDFIMNGAIVMSAAEATASLTMDMYMRDRTTGDSILMEDYVFTAVEFDDYSVLEVSGRFYSSDYGYITLSTEEAIIVSDYEDYPSEGIILAAGADDSSARLSFLTSGTYCVEVDEDGDGTYEYDSGILSWDE